MGMLELIVSGKAPWQAIDAEHKFAKKRFVARYLWEQTAEISLQMRRRYSRNGHF
jgi:hypothetical protein